MQLKHYYGHASLQRNVIANVPNTWDMIEVKTDYWYCFSVIIQKCIIEQKWLGDLLIRSSCAGKLHSRWNARTNFPM